MNHSIETLRNIQQRILQLDQALSSTLANIASQPEASFKRLSEIEEEFDEFSYQWSAWLEEFARFSPDQAVGFQEIYEQKVTSFKFDLVSSQATCLKLMGKYDEAAQALGQAVSYSKNAPIYRQATFIHEIGSFALQRGKFQEAESHLSNAESLYWNSITIEYFVLILSPENTDFLKFNDQEKAEYQAARLALAGIAKVKSELANVALQQEKRTEFLEQQQAAIDFAEQFHLLDLVRSFKLRLGTWERQWDTKGDAPSHQKSNLENFKKEIKKKEEDERTISQQLNLFLEEAENNRVLYDGSATAIFNPLKKAKRLLEGHPELHYEHYRLHLAYAEHYEQQGAIDHAYEHAEVALEHANKLGMPDIIQVATDMLVSVASSDEATAAQKKQAYQQLDKTIELLRELQNYSALLPLLFQRTYSYMLEEKYERARTDLNEALGFAELPVDQYNIHLALAGLEKKVSNIEAAFVSLKKAIQLHLTITNDQLSIDYSDWLHKIETLHEGAAILAAELGKPHEALTWAEQGRIRLLQQQLTSFRTFPAQKDFLAGVSLYDQELWSTIQSESIAFLFFCVGYGKTLAILVDPKQTTPHTYFLELTKTDLQADKLLERLWPEHNEPQENFIKTLSEISTKMLDPIQNPLMDVLNRCRVLYVVPDSRLNLIPFSALTLNDKLLLDYPCALSIAPSITNWWWLRNRQTTSERNYLAVGVGSEQDFSFAQQVKTIFGRGSRRNNPTYLLDEDGQAVTPEQFWNAAKIHTVIHISCHGKEEKASSGLDALSTLNLLFSDHQLLRAKEVHDHQNELSAELVFLNACMSGRFRLRRGLVLGGFWLAFIHAGTAAVIMTLARVHPEDAELLATLFYKNWAENGMSKAKALQLAQRKVRQQKGKSFHWARYIIVGDYR